MAYIGKTPTPQPLTATDIPDLPATKITSGTFPALNGSNLTNLDAADLTGTLPAISGANLTGISTDFVKLSSATASNSASLSFNLTTATYDNFLLLGHKIRPATDSVSPYLYFSEDSGSSYLTTTMYSGRNFIALTGSATTNTERNDISGAAQLGTDLGNDKDGGCQIWLYGMANAFTGANKFCHSTWVAGHQTNDYHWDTGFICIGNNAINNVKIQMSSGNITSGVFTLYGLVK